MQPTYSFILPEGIYLTCIVCSYSGGNVKQKEEVITVVISNVEVDSVSGISL